MANRYRVAAVVVTTLSPIFGVVVSAASAGAAPRTSSSFALPPPGTEAPIVGHAQINPGRVVNLLSLPNAANPRRAPSVVPQSTTPHASISPSLTPPNVVIQNFPGASAASVGSSSAPPDSNGAVGGTFIVEADNQTLQVYSRGVGVTPTLLKGPTYIGNLFGGTSDKLSDPRVFYDNAWKRFVLVDITVPQSCTAAPALWMAVSQTSDPTGNWISDRITFSGASYPLGTITDFDMDGMDANSVLVSTNNVDGCTTPPTKNTGVFAVPKQRLYNGPLPSSIPVFSVPKWTHPAFVEGIPQNLDSRTYLVASQIAIGTGTGFDLYYMTESWSPGSTRVVFAGSVSDPAKPKSPPCAHQPSPGSCLDTGFGQLTAAPHQLNGLLWVSRTVANGSRAAVEYGYISEKTRAAKLAMTSVTSTSYDFNPSIAAADAGGGRAYVWLNWSSTDPSPSHPQNVSMRVSGLSPGDVPVNLGPSSITLATGGINTAAGVGSFGDFSSVNVDSQDAGCGLGKTALAVNELLDSSSSGGWKMQDARVEFC